MAAFYRLYEVAGENFVTMQAARLFARSAKGWSVAAVADAADAAAGDLLEMLQPYATELISQECAAGRHLVMATTSPAPLVTPFAAALNLDGVVATQWSSQDGSYTGSVDGPFVWAKPSSSRFGNGRTRKGST